MKRILPLILSIFLSQGLFAQFLDSSYIRVQYEAKSKNIVDSDKIFSDWYYLDAGVTASFFYSFYDNYSDSTKRSLLLSGLSNEDIFLRTKSLKRGSEDKIFKNYESNSLMVISKILEQHYLYEEAMERQNWELLKDTAVIENYKCLKAKCRFRGREWIAWYTPDIPMIEGPWKLWGLPGLILKAEDAKGEFSFVCKGISLLVKKKAILLPVEASKNKYIKTEGRTFMQIKRKSVEDLKNSLASQGMTVVSVTNEKGLKTDIQKKRMNAIESYE
ncbi:MAG: GLPGLI family protein [Bacteroidales bacterium]|jgi:GLPGLI family protein